MDLTKNKIPFGFLDKETQKAFRNSKGKVEVVSGWGEEGPIWKELESPGWYPATVYRVKYEPMERWMVVDPCGFVVKNFSTKSLADRCVEEQYPSARVVHMREVV